MPAFGRPVRARAFGAALATAVLAAGGARGQVFTTPERALAQACPGARLEHRERTLDDDEARAVESAAKARLAARTCESWAVWRGDTLAATAFLDTRTVRTMPASVLVVVAPDTTVRRVEILAFHEPSDFRPPARWLGLFAHRRLSDSLWPRRDIAALSGATLTARAITESVRLALALYSHPVAPKPAAAAGAEKR